MGARASARRRRNMRIRGNTDTGASSSFRFGWGKYQKLSALELELSAAALADRLGDSQQQAERADGQAAHSDHQGDPAAVAVRSLATRDAAKAGEDEQRRDRAGEEERRTGREKLARVIVEPHGHLPGGHQRHAACMAYTTTPVTETYSQIGKV